MALSKVTICGINTKELPLLKGEEAKKILSLAKSGDVNARETFIKANLRLVLSIVGRFSQTNEPVDDLFQIGCIGMIKAIDNFNMELNVQFSTYAVPMIIGEIKRFLRDGGSIRVSRSLKDLAYKAISTKELLTIKNQKEPSITEIAEALNLPKENIVIALEAVAPSISLYEPVYNEGGDTLYVIDQLSDNKCWEDLWVKELSLEEAFSKLGEREKQIISLRFFEDKTQSEVAKVIGISQAQVSRLEKCVLKNMKKVLSSGI